MDQGLMHEAWDGGVLNREDVISRALGYPYPRPATSFLFQDGEAKELPENFKPDPSFIPVLAIGSNASPLQLRRKYGKDETIPVLAVDVHGLDVAYGALLSGYACIPATAVASKGTVVNIHLTLMSQSALQRMHLTEKGYHFCKVVQSDEVFVEFKDSCISIPGDIFIYIGKLGALLLDGQAYALAELTASGRVLPPLRQELMLKSFHSQLPEFGHETLEEFIYQIRIDNDRRARVMTQMKSAGLDACFEIVQTL